MTIEKQTKKEVFDDSLTDLSTLIILVLCKSFVKSIQKHYYTLLAKKEVFDHITDLLTYIDHILVQVLWMI